jgi:hypothetical protein
VASDSDKQRNMSRLLPVIALVLAISYVVAILVGLVDKDDRLSEVEVILLIALLVLATYSIETIDFGPSGFRARLNSLDLRQQKLESEVRALQVTLSGLITKWELMHLQSLAREKEPARVKFSREMVRELHHLHHMGFLEPLNPDSLEDINAHDESPDAFNLKEYVKITIKGQEYLDLRAELAPEERP